LAQLLVSLALILESSGGPSISHHGGPSTEAPSPSTSILQSGPFDRCIFQPLEVSQSQLFKSTSSNSTSSQIFAIESPADDNGYPGKIRVEVLIRVLPPTNSSEKSSKGRISILYRTKLLDSKVISTPINLTHHWGFNLSETSPETGIKNVDSHELEILPSKTTPHSNEVQLLEMSNTTNLPTGKFSSTKATSHDFQKVRKIKDEKKGNQDFPEGGFDHFYIFGPPSKSTSKSTSISDLESSLETSRSSQPPSTILSCPSSKTTLTFKTNQSGVQLYTANGQPPFPAPSNAGGSRKLLHQSEKEKKGVGHGNGERSAAFLEFSHPHGNFLHESLREISGSSTLVKGHWEEKEIVENENWVEVEVWKGE